MCESVRFAAAHFGIEQIPRKSWGYVSQEKVLGKIGAISGSLLIKLGLGDVNLR